jgi:hypothetical protein
VLTKVNQSQKKLKKKTLRMKQKMFSFTIKPKINEFMIYELTMNFCKNFKYVLEFVKTHEGLIFDNTKNYATVEHNYFLALSNSIREKKDNTTYERFLYQEDELTLVNLTLGPICVLMSESTVPLKTISGYALCINDENRNDIVELFSSISAFISRLPTAYFAHDVDQDKFKDIFAYDFPIQNNVRNTEVDTSLQPINNVSNIEANTVSQTDENTIVQRERRNAFNRFKSMYTKLFK